MEKYLESYIDNNVIREHAFKGRDGYSLQIIDLDEHEQESLISNLFAHDPVVKEMLLDRAQELINSRIGFVESKDKFREGYFPRVDRSTGDVRWLKAGSL